MRLILGARNHYLRHFDAVSGRRSSAKKSTKNASNGVLRGAAPGTEKRADLRRPLPSGKLRGQEVEYHPYPPARFQFAMCNEP